MNDSHRVCIFRVELRVDGGLLIYGHVWGSATTSTRLGSGRMSIKGQDKWSGGVDMVPSRGWMRGMSVTSPGAGVQAWTSNSPAVGVEAQAPPGARGKS